VRGATLQLLNSVALASGLALAVVGCGGTSEASSPAALRLQREDLVGVSHALMAAESSVGREVAATRRAWPLIVNGLPADPSTIARPPIAAATTNAAQIKLPVLLGEAQATSLTGPAAGIDGLFRTYSGLAARGWRLVGAAIDEIEHGSPAGARFARENAALYIESIYDGHFELAQIGKKLSDGYRMLGGPAAFGGTLSQTEVNALASTYSEATDRLHPHVGVRLGS
jgi:hypothetical protein